MNYDSRRPGGREENFSNREERIEFSRGIIAGMTLWQIKSMPPANLTARFLRNFCACFLALLLCGGNLVAEGVSLDLGGGVKMEFVWVPVTTSGAKKEIKIGDFSNPEGKEPVQKELIWGPFQMADKGFGYYLGKTEVTEAQWAAVTGAGSKSSRPVASQSHQAIQDFIQKLNSGALGGQFTGLPRKADSTPGVIRLPTESEWEYAARCGAGPDYKNKHPYGEDREVERFEVIASPGAAGKAREVATLPPNKLGLFDMLGNVREFVDGTYSAGGSQILKGGSYLSEKQEIRSAARTEQPPFGKDGKPTSRPDAGFRLCITAPEHTALGQTAIPVEKDPGDPDGENGLPPENPRYKEAMELLDTALENQKKIHLRAFQITTLEQADSTGFYKDRIAKHTNEIAEKEKSLNKAVELLGRMHGENRGQIEKAVADYEAQLSKKGDSDPRPGNDSDAMRALKKRLGF